MEWPPLEPVTLALTVSAALDCRPARMPQVPVQPLFSEHRDECGEQRDQETRVHESSDGNDLLGMIFLDWRGKGVPAQDGGLVESEKDCTEEDRSLLVRIRLQLRLDIDDKRRADRGEQTGLRDE